MAVPGSRGGLGLGTGGVSLGLTLVIVLLVRYLSVSRIDVRSDAPDAQPRAATLSLPPAATGSTEIPVPEPGV
jgi:hypothetical protein